MDLTRSPRIDSRTESRRRIDALVATSATHITIEQLKIMIFHRSTNRFSEPERWMRWSADRRGIAPEPDVMLAHIPQLVPPTRTTRAETTGTEPSGPTRRLYVGNLPYQLTEPSLADYFGRIGEIVSAQLVVDRETGRSKGFGFVEMRTHSAEQAVAELNGKDFGGRDLVVNYARPREERPAGRFRQRSW
ncbi:hypothetical protein [Virgisporangium aurantiacum]|uniref:RRM domain-containing protein n=1 Tax=Virgisporangium aurantiacum TaxID=175570 RepID=A0A8J3Z7Q3_9ACTN|nr:hypothetical protein [Virgisporangium aurantiacum]GIJ58919.1 hypothetical protein Vau01_064350 [Virgisporangium aurantiacum]